MTNKSGEVRTARSARGGRRRNRYPTIEQLMSRLTARDFQILYSLYMARALPTRELSLRFWPNSPIDRGQSARALRYRIRQLEEWGLIRKEPSHMDPPPLVTSWKEPTEGELVPWGKVITIDNRGIRMLVRAGLIPETKSAPTEEVVPAYAKAAEVRPAPSQVDHCFLIGAAVLRAIKDNWTAFRWWGSRYCVETVHPDSAVLPDALVASPLHTWSFEADKGTITEAHLLERWRKQGIIWDEIRQRGIEMEGRELPPVAGVLWYCADRSAARLYGRIWRLRLGMLQFDSAIPPSLSWYVDSFDGMAWTWRRWLLPWTLGKAPHPQAILQQAVQDWLGVETATNVQCVAALGNMAAWQAVQTWASQRAVMRPGQSWPEWCIVLVRDELEARGIWYIAEQARVQDYLLLVIDQLNSGKEPAIDLQHALWRHQSGPEWLVVDARERILHAVSGTPYELRSINPQHSA